MQNEFPARQAMALSLCQIYCLLTSVCQIHPLASIECGSEPPQRQNDVSSSFAAQPLSKQHTQMRAPSRFTQTGHFSLSLGLSRSRRRRSKIVVFGSNLALFSSRMPHAPLEDLHLGHEWFVSRIIRPSCFKSERHADFSIHGQCHNVLRTTILL